MFSSLRLSPQSSPAQRGRRILRRVWVPILLIAAALVVPGTIATMHSDALSPVDEWVYADYLYKLPAQGIVHQGEEIGEDALDLMACDGVKPYGPMGAPCGGDYGDVSAFPFGGITSADAYTPLYFAATRWVGDAIHEATGIDQLTSWRLTGSLWLAVSVVMMFALLRQWRVRPVTILGLGLAFIASPFSWWTYSYVSTDAPSFLFGALLLFLAVRYSRGHISGWWLPAVSVLAVLFKVTNILAVCLVALYLLVVWIVEFNKRDWQGWRTPRTGTVPGLSVSLVGFAALSVVAAGSAQIIWLALRRALAVGDAADQSIGIYLGGQELLAQVTNFLPGTILANVNISGSTGFAYPIATYITAPLSWICIAGVLGAFAMLQRRSPHAPIIIAVAIASALFAPMLAVVIHLTTGSYFPLPPRYGASILPGILLVAGITLRNRWASWLLLAYAAALLITVLITAPSFA